MSEENYDVSVRVHTHPELKNIINCAVANLIHGNLNGSMKNVTVTLSDFETRRI
jgi:hypothetical protein